MRDWPVVIIGPRRPADLVVVKSSEFIADANQTLWSVEALRKVTPAFQGCPVFSGHGVLTGPAAKLRPEPKPAAKPSAPTAPAAPAVAKPKEPKPQLVIGKVDGWKRHIGQNVRVGKLQDPFWCAEEREVRATLLTTPWWDTELCHWQEMGQLYEWGLSISIADRLVVECTNGWVVILEIHRLFGVDLVDWPATGGRFL